MIRVLFTGKQHRVRRRETIENPPEGIEFVSQQEVNEMAPDFKISTGSVKNSIFSKIKDIFTYNNYIPKRFLKNINLIYSPGKLVFNKFPWVIEIDNVTVMTYYNLTILNTFKPIVKKILKSKYCKKIICISKAAKISTINYFNDKKIEEKIEVIYPYIKLGEHIQKNKNKISFLCCNTKFYMKGTLIVLNAFKELLEKYNNIELTIISNTPEKIKNQYAHPKIKFFDAKFKKEELYEQFYSKCDVFVQPTLQDSFGLVYLEVMANKMAIISTDVFAIPEFIENGKNGFLSKAPFDMYNPDKTPKKEFFSFRDESDWEETLFKPHNLNKNLTTEFKNYMELLIKSPELLKKMQEASYQIIQENFSEEKRKKELGKILIEGAKENVRN